MKQDEEEDDDKDGDEDEDEGSFLTSKEPFRMIARLIWAEFTIKKKWLPTDGRTDGRRDKASYRDAWTHLKIVKV